MAHDHHDSEQTVNNHGRNPPKGYTDSGSHALPGGLTVATNGLLLKPSETRIDPEKTREWAYQIHDEEGNVVSEFEETHDQLAHLILVRRDLTRFQHLHPTLADDGTWSVEFTLPDPGVYRAFVDIRVDGQPTTLGVDLLSSGPAQYDAHPRPMHETEAMGYEVELTPEKVPPGETISIEFEVRQDGHAAYLESYLGALGHLVALRDGDLAYLHVHPKETDPEDGIIRFAVQFPTAGRYRLFLQAKPAGELITTSFDVYSEER
ncbi:hypothetical protein [Natrinema sp. 1APR25-10V2]|uniref:hypothetical protein n=1 Tax=Natrinema sp. 1APR25-10V2 TaxID=2951081 RepID=UPI0028768AEC|nr:hypothetical protein [Natrinema sp. 1APR25-10V2]MDS0474601.1 FixH family protein [Natrinema sp. 1APR25-10V2]